MVRRGLFVLLGLFFIAWGLNLLGLVPMGPLDLVTMWVVKLWPLVFVVVGARWAQEGWRRPRGLGVVWGTALMGLGVLWSARNLGLAPDGALLGGFLLGAGAGFLLRAWR